MERRKHTRIPHRLCLTIDELPGRNIAFTTDVSQDGISIVTQTPLAMGRSVTIKLALPTGKTLNIIGHVRWVERNPLSKGGMNQYGIGISCQNMPEEFQHFITSLATAQQRHTAPPPAPPAPAQAKSESDNQLPEPQPVMASNDTLKQQRQHEMTGVQPNAVPPAEPPAPVQPVETKSESDNELPDPQPIMAAYEAMKQQNHYEVLGVEPKATHAQIKQAYYTLSKTYHPDGPLGECSKELKHNLEELFHRVAEAYVTLSSDDQRKRYDRALAKQQAELSQTALTKRYRSGQHVQQGLRELEAGNFEAAAASFDLACQARPEKWKYHTLLAYSLSKLPGREQDAEAHYRQAIALEPSRAENYIGLGRIYQRVGQASDALRAFEDALEWDAENTRIIKEIDAIKKQ